MNVPPALSTLEATDLVRRLGEPDLAFLIKHALVQDSSVRLTAQERTQASSPALWRGVGRCCIPKAAPITPRGSPNTLLRQATTLNLHCMPRGREMMPLASYATAEALRQYNAALDAALRIDAASPEIIELATKLGRMYRISERQLQARLQPMRV